MTNKNNPDQRQTDAEHITTAFTPRDPQFEDKVRSSFERQKVMTAMQVTLAQIQPGFIELHMPYQETLTQQHGFLHAGIVTTVMDSACGYAAFSLMTADAAVLSVEFKVNLLAPADGESFRFTGQVIKSGRTITVCEGRAYAYSPAKERLVATMSATMMAVYNRPGVDQ